MRPPLLPWLVAGCLGEPPRGTAVGNPGDADAKVSRTDPALDLQLAQIAVDRLLLTDCSGHTRALPRPLVLDGLAPSPSLLRLPPGTFCEISLSLSEPLRLEGSTTSGTTFTAELPVDLLPALGPLSIDGQHLLFELPLPLDSDTIDLLGDTAILPTDPLAITWSDTLRDSVRLWEDLDDDGLLSPADLEIVPFDTGHPAALQSAETRCGCATRQGPLSWGLFARRR